VTEAEIMAKVQTYMFQNLRAPQDSHNAFQCLEASLTSEARLVMYAERDKYTIRRGDVPNAVPGGDPEERRQDGLMFLWCIINRTTAKTNATITNIVRKINNLRYLMIEKDSNVMAFNTSVRQLLNAYFANKRAGGPRNITHQLI
jgi:hypothetical protein